MNRASIEKKKTLFSVLFVACIDNFGFGIVFILFAPLMLNPKYGMLSADASEGLRNSLLSVLFFSFPLMQFFGAPLLGDIADRFGRKKAFYATIAGATVGYLFSAFAIALHSFIFLLFSRLWTGFFSGNLSICLASIADLSHDEKSRARNFGWITVVWGFSWPVAILIGGYLSDPSVSAHFGPALPFYITFLLSLANLAVIGKLFKETHPRAERLQINVLKGIHNVIAAAKVKAIRPFFVILLLWTIGWGLSVQWYGAYSIEKFKISQLVISWGLILQGIFWGIGGSFINPQLLKKLSVRTTAIIGLAWAFLFVLGCGLMNAFWPFSWVYFIAALGAAFSLSNVMNLCSACAPIAIQGKVMGLSQSMMSLGWCLVPAFAAGMSNLNMALFYPMAALFLLAACVVLNFEKMPKIKRGLGA